jgi:putative transposase
VSLPRDMATVSEAEWELAIRRSRVMDELLVRGSAASVSDAAREQSLSIALMYRLLARYRRNPSPGALLPGTAGPAAGFRRLEPGVETLVQREIDSFYLSKERPRVADVHRRIAIECRKRNIQGPSYKAIWTRIRDLDPAIVVRHRESPRASKERFAPVSSGLRPKRPLELCQIDHTLADVILVDELERKPIGRPWLTIVIDVATRMVAGFHLSLDPPSSTSVALAISHAVLPKKADLEELGADASWPVEGLLQTIHLDNAKEFHGRALERGCREYGIALRFRPPGTPHFGGHIERLIGTLMDDVHLLPGTTFSSVEARGQYPSESRASLTMREFKRWLTLQIVQIYHRRPHRSIGKSPLAAWTSTSEGTLGLRRPPDANKFYIDFLPGELRLIRRDGIRLFNIHYWHSVLSVVAGRSTQKYLIRYDPTDLSHVFVQAPGETHYTKVPYRDLGYPAISLTEYKSALKKLNSSKVSSVDENAIFAAIGEQRALVEMARKDSAAARRLRAKSSARQKPSPTRIAAASDDEGEMSMPVEPYSVEVWE